MIFFFLNLLLQNIYAQELNSVGLLKPIKLDTGWNKILLDQYFENVNLITGVHADSTLDVQFIADPGQLLIKSKIHHGPYGTIEFNYKGDPTCWIFIHPIKQSITLSLNNNNYTYTDYFKTDKIKYTIFTLLTKFASAIIFFIFCWFSFSITPIL